MDPSTPDLIARNVAFQLLSPADKRRAIARDIISRLDAKRLIPFRGDWLRVFSPLFEDVQLALESDVPCETCVLGAAATGLAHFGDKLSFESITDSFTGKPVNRLPLAESGAADRLIALFGIPQLILIERCYETSPIFHLETPEGRRSGHNAGNKHVTDDILDAAAPFRKTVPDKDDALRLIWTYVEQDPEGRFDPARALEMRDGLLTRHQPSAEQTAKPEAAQ